MNGSRELLNLSHGNSPKSVTSSSEVWATWGSPKLVAGI